jgi:hypothetical protein
MNRVAIVFLFSLFLVGCEKKIDFDLEEAEPKLVVEATIENGTPPIVFLSRSLNYFSEISPQLLANSFVHGAQVTISNGTKTHQLKEYAVPLIGGYSLFYYSIDSSNLASSFNGELNKKYTLQIVSEGKTYTSQTTIPAITRRIDSLWWKSVSTDTSNKDVQVMIKAYDPPGFGDYVRYWTKKNRGAFLPGFTSVYDDLVIDGTTYELNVEPGVDRNEDNGFDPEWFQRGDTVTLKLSNIDKATYDFWRTMEYTYSSVGNPFSTPVKVLSNVNNGALGYFGGYASQYRTIIIPR